jgi:23S rRNA (cytidine2498-2'-O)-methyltransferase
MEMEEEMGDPPSTSPATKFLFLCCQLGTEQVCKQQIEARWPEFRFSFSRPGFLTYKVPQQTGMAFDLENTYARTFGFAVDRVEGEDIDALAEQVWARAVTDLPNHLHVWQRDPRKVGESFEPFTTELTNRVVERLNGCRPAACKSIPVNSEASPNDRVLDCILVEENRWWIGEHRVSTTFQAWPGGVPPFKPKFDVISRAYYKTQEALLWSRLPIHAGDQCVEIGSAPGGAAQALLEYKLKIIGIDPAEMDPSIAQHENYRHIRKRGRDVRRREFSDARWLFSDSNVTPKQSLDTIEDIVSHASVRVQGMLITLKMPEWKLAHELDNYLDRIRSWGYQYVKPRHLAFNRQELCIVAMRHRSLKRF